MSLPKINVAKLNLIIIILSVFFLFPSKIFSQNKYDFNFDSQWKWGGLIDKVVIINPSLIKSVNLLKSKISNENARIILKELSELDSLKYLSKLSSIAKLNSDKKSVMWDSILTRSFDTLFIIEDFSGLISAAIRLSEIRIAEDGRMFEFEDRSYLPQPVKEYKKNIEINFNYSGVETVLNFFERDTNYINEIFESEPYKIILKDKSLNGISKDDLKYFLSASLKNDPLFSIYKWVNPESFWNMGGVSIYKNNFQNVVNNLKQNERNIKLDIEKLVSRYLPDSSFFNVDVMFMLGRKGPGWFSGNNMLGIDLEYFGDDYDYLVRFIQHEVFKFAQREIQLPVDEFVVKSYDKTFVKVLSNILENGTANYVGPVGTETRPWYLLEKDFKLFNNTYHNIYKKNNFRKADSLINIGYSGDAPFYTMSTQMAYIIETTLGRNALIESIKCGPIYFFSKYIEAYKENPDKIRKVFTFREKLEKKISKMKVLFPHDIISDALKMKKCRNDTSALNEHITKFFKKYNKKDNQNLLNLLSGQLFLEAGEYSKAKNFFLKGILNQTNSIGKLAGEIAESFFKDNAISEALDFYNLYVENSPQDASAYEKRGEYFYKTRNDEKARNDFEKAMIIDSKRNIAKAYLEKISSNK